MLSSVNALLKTTFDLYRKEFWFYLGYAAWLLVPIAAFYFASALPAGSGKIFLIVLTVVLQLFAWLWIMVCLMRATALLTSHQPMNQQTLSTAALERIRDVLVILILQALIILGGLLLFLIPGIIFWIWYALAQIAAGVDGKHPIESLTYSRALVQGRFFAVLWRILAGLTTIGLFYAFLSGLVLLLLATVIGADQSQIFSDTPPLWSQLVQSIIDVFFVPLFLIYSTILYLNLKASMLEKDRTIA